MLLTLGAVAVWVVLELVLRKDRSWRSWVVDGAIVAAVLLACRLLLAEVQVRVLSWIAAAMLLGLLLMTVVVLARFMASIATIRKRYLRELPVERLESDELVIPEPLRHDIAKLEGLGFHLVTRSIDKHGGIVAHLLRPSDGIVAESQIDPDAEGSTLDLTSVLDGGRGILVTRTSGLDLRLWDAEFLQAFPGATAEHLLANHQDGLAFLRERGIVADTIEADQLMSVRAALVARSAAAARTVPSKAFRQEAARNLRREHANVGRLRDRPDAHGQIERFLLRPP